MHPVIGEFIRIRATTVYRNQVFRRHQRQFKDEIQPMLDERDRLLVENAELKARITALELRLAPVIEVGKEYDIEPGPVTAEPAKRTRKAPTP
jgi:nucleosome binding factor SPN SPT16 subunit